MRKNHKTLKLSPSKVELWAKYDEGKKQHGYATFQAVKDSIMGVRTFSDKANIGTAMHALIEHGSQKYKTENGLLIQEDGMESPVSLDLETGAYFDAFRANLKGAQFEQWFEPIFESSMGPVKIRLRIDMILGRIVNDFKTTEITDKRDPMNQLQGFSDSSQWRFYLWATGFDTAQYHLFKYKTLEQGNLDIKYSEISFNRYEQMETDLNDLICGCVEFCLRNDLMEYITV